MDFGDWTKEGDAVKRGPWAEKKAFPKEIQCRITSGGQSERGVKLQKKSIQGRMIASFKGASSCHWKEIGGRLGSRGGR